MATTAVRQTDIKIWVDWNFDDIYTEETNNLVSAQGEMRLIPIGASIFATQGIISQCSVTLYNRKEGDGGRRYSSLDTRSDLTANIATGGAYHVPMYIEISTDNGGSYDRVFTGVMKIPAEAGAAITGVGEITLDCRSMEELYLNKRLTTTHADFTANHGSGVTEAELITQWLEDVGLTSADYVIDKGLFSIPWAWLDNESVIEACWTLAAACGGRFYARPDGKLVYENAAHWLSSPHNTTSPAVFGKSTYARIRPRWVDAELYNEIEVAYNLYDINESGTLWESNEVLFLPASGSKTITAQFSSPAYTINTATFNAITPTGQDNSGSVTLAQTNYAQRATLQFTNGTALDLWVPNAKITGRAVSSTTTAPITMVNETAWNTYWGNRAGRTRTTTNRFIQSRIHAETMAQMLRDWHQQPRLFYALEQVKADAAYRLGDRIRVTDDDISNSNQEAFVTAINWSYTQQSGFRMGFEAVDDYLLYPAYSSATEMDYFILDVDTMTDSDFGDAEFLFY